jgi:hypothetical protein
MPKKQGLWDNIKAKQERIKKGSGETMREPGSKGAPTDKDLRVSAMRDGGFATRGHGAVMKGKRTKCRMS